MVAAQETTLQSLLEGTKQYLVPLYQRPYQWSNKQLKQLWSDIEELTFDRHEGGQSSHFIGSLVLSPAPSVVAGGMSPWLVVDGQQRLTTLALLLAAIRDHIHSLDPDDPLAEEIHNSFLVNQYKRGSEHIKLVPTQVDRDSYNAIINRLPDAGGDDTIGVAYRYFRGRIADFDDPDDPHDIETLKTAVADGLDLVSISANQNDNVHRIFQSLNNTGLKLTQGDLLRNYIFMRLPETGEEAYQRYWVPLQEALTNAELEALFWIDLAQDYPTAKMSDVYQYQQRRLEKLTTEEEIHQDLERLVKLANLYRVVVNPQLESNAAVRTRLERLHQWDLSTPHPIVLRLLRSRADGFSSNEELANALLIIESYLVRRFLVGKPSQGLNRNFRVIVSTITDDEPVDTQVKRWLSTGRRHFINDEELHDAILNNPYYRTGKAEHRHVFLEWLEREFQSKEPVDTSQLTIEHVMPQTLNSSWVEELKASYPDEDIEALHEQWVHTLGNLTLSGYNSQLSNRDFGWKKKELAQSGLRLSSSIVEKDSWGPREIAERARRLARLIIGVWPGPMENPSGSTDVSPRWRKLRQLMVTLPAGHWTAYGDLAAAIGSGAQAVGNYVAANELPNAHRVLRTDGTVSANFKWLDAEDSRDPYMMLEKEGVTFSSGGRASRGQRLWAEQLLDLLEMVEGEAENGTK